MPILYRRHGAALLAAKILAAGDAGLRARVARRAITAAYLQTARDLGVDVLVASEGRHSLVGEIAAGLHVDLHLPRGHLFHVEEQRNYLLQGSVLLIGKDPCAQIRLQVLNPGTDRGLA